jgi:taurine dioxygenase
VLHVPDMTPDQHLAIARHFGEAEVHTFYPNLGQGYEQITVIDSKLGDRADMWHHDELSAQSAHRHHDPCAHPAAHGGDTCWISMTSAYDALSPQMKQYLDGLSAWHDMNSP